MIAKEVKWTWLPRGAFLERAVLSMPLSTPAIVLGALVGLGCIDLVMYDAAQSTNTQIRRARRGAK